MQEFITVRQFAERFNMPISTVYKYMNNHTIPSIKIGRSRKIDIAQADKFIINDGVVCSLPKEGAKNMTIKDMIRKPLTATGTICSSRSSNGKVKWYLRKFPLRYKNQRGDIEYAQHPGFETREQAERFRKLCIKERNRLDELSFDNPSVYEEFKKYVKLYREPNWENQSTSDNMTSFIENHLKPVFEYIGIKDVTTDDLQAFYLRQNKVRDVKKPLSIMRKFFDRLYRHKKISYDPCCDVSIPTHVSLHPQNRTPLSKQEEEAFFKELISSDRASVKRYRHGILLMIFSGVRPGEICGSEWSNIDFKECTYKVRKTWRRSGSKCEEKSTTKTGTIGERTVPFHPLCLSYLKSAKERSNSKWILENHKTKQPIRTENLRKVVRQIAKDAGLLTNRNIYPYLFRHTFITDAARSGILPIDLRFLVGHVDDKMINKVYAFHYDENAINKYRNIFNSMFETGINHENS